MTHTLQPKGREFDSTCVLFFYLYSIRLISFIIDVPRPLTNEILDHSILKGWCITLKTSQSVRNRDLRENIVPYYSQNIRLKIRPIRYTCCLNLSSVGKRLKKSMRQVLALRHVKSTENQFHISSVRWTLSVRILQK